MSAAPPAPVHLELPVGGMTCASCAARVERRLNKLEGVTASVNYATERASVDYDPALVGPEALVAAVEAAGYTAALPPAAAPVPAPSGSGEVAAEPSAHEADLRRRLVVAWALGLPVVVLGMAPALQFDRWQWLALQLATPVVLWAGWPFHRATLRNLRHGAVTMDTLISVGTLAAWGWSVVALLALDAGRQGMKMPFELALAKGASGSRIYLEAAVAVVAFLLAGRFFETRAKRRAGAALRALLELGAKEATLVDAVTGAERLVLADQLHPGDLFAVRPGERVATDGVVVEGRSAVDRSLLTGESIPVETGPGDEVTGATVNLGGRLLVRATRVGADTALAQIARLVTEAQSGKAPVQRLADRVAGVFVPVVIALSLATLAFWLVDGAGAAFAFSAAVAVLVVACPCALGLATPTALLVGTGRGAQLGLLIRGPEILESTRKVDTVVLDKTGTITEGRMSLAGVTVVAEAEVGGGPGGLAIAAALGEDEVLHLAGSLEAYSEHPVGRAVAGAAARRRPLSPVEGFRSRNGLGVEGTVDGRVLVAGRPELLEQWGVSLPDDLAGALAAAQELGRTAVAVAVDGRAAAVLAVADAIKPTSVEAVRELRALGLRPVLLTGDNAPTARAVAAAVGIDEVVADVLPAGKAEVVARLQAEGCVVAMVGDGVNDAPALARADLGLAIGTGTDVAIEAGDLTLVSGDLRAAADAIRLARRTLRTIEGNLFWAFAYNVAALPLAVLGYLNPLVAGGAMALSSVFVLSNSLRLRRFQPRRA